jgi:acyl-CoA dehydrogenase
VISFGLTEEQELIRDAMREFGEQVLRAAARDADETESVPDAVLDQTWELGLLSTQLPEAYGGQGEARSPVTNAIALEALAYGDAALALAATQPASFAFPILDQGTDDQKQRYLPLFCGATFHAAALALVEPTPVFDVAAVQTSAEPKGDVFLLSGTKSFVPLGDRSSHFLVVARNTARTEEGVAALDAFVVARDAKGLTVSDREKNLGLRALPTHTVTLEKVEVAAADRLGGDAGCDVRRIVANARTGLAVAMVGLSHAVMDYAVPYAKERKAFGEFIAQKQAIAFMLSDMAVETDATRWLAWKAASQLEQGLDPVRAAHFARSYAAEQTMKIADNGLQVLGGHGYIREHPVELWYRQARTLSVLEGVASL